MHLYSFSVQRHREGHSVFSLKVKSAKVQCSMFKCWSGEKEEKRRNQKKKKKFQKKNLKSSNSLWDLQPNQEEKRRNQTRKKNSKKQNFFSKKSNSLWDFFFFNFFLTQISAGNMKSAKPGLSSPKRMGSTELECKRTRGLGNFSRNYEKVT